MTKYSKIKKSSFAILALSLILVAVLAFGGTYAYFTDQTDKVSSTLTTASLSVDTNAASVVLATDSIVVPNQPIITDKITVTPTMDTNVIIIAQVSLVVDPENNKDGETISTSDFQGYFGDVIFSALNHCNFTNKSYITTVMEFMKLNK